MIFFIRKGYCIHMRAITSTAYPLSFEHAVACSVFSIQAGNIYIRKILVIRCLSRMQVLRPKIYTLFYTYNEELCGKNEEVHLLSPLS